MTPGASGRAAGRQQGRVPGATRRLPDGIMLPCDLHPQLAPSLPTEPARAPPAPTPSPTHTTAREIIQDTMAAAAAARPLRSRAPMAAAPPGPARPRPARLGSARLSSAAPRRRPAAQRAPQGGPAAAPPGPVGPGDTVRGRGGGL